jgi:hypothetical protein
VKGEIAIRNDRILDWAINRVRSQQKGDVSLLVTYGSHLAGTETPVSDVDFYFVPRTRRAYELAQTFIVEGVGYDLSPMTWRRLAGLARLEEPLIPLLGNCKIVFFSSDDDLNRFNRLRLFLEENLANRTFMHECATRDLSLSIQVLEGSKPPIRSARREYIQEIFFFLRPMRSPMKTERISETAQDSTSPT